MNMLWMGGLADPGQNIERNLSQTRTPGLPAEAQAAIRDLEHHVARLSLMNQALWELVREKARLTDKDLEEKAREIDLRDGVEDGKVTDVALKCPTCGRVSNSKHYKCLYCGQLFEKPVFG